MSGMTIPTIPNMPAGYVVQLADMQNLAAAATFALTKPVYYNIDVTGAFAITGGYQVINTFTAGGVQYDPDGMFNVANAGHHTVQTPGWYKVRYGVNCGNSGGTYETAIRSMTGGNNPQGAGVTSANFWGGYADCAASNYAFPGASGIWPFYMYKGDFFQLVVKAAASGTSTSTSLPGGATNGGTWIALEYVSIT